VGRTIASPEDVRFDVSASANLWDQVKLNGEIHQQTLVARINLTVRQLKIKEILAFAPEVSSVRVLREKSRLTQRLRLRACAGLGRPSTAAGGCFSVVQRDGTRSQAIERLGQLRKGSFRRPTGAPRADCAGASSSGEFRSQANSFSAAVKIRGMDIAETGKRVLAIHDDQTVQNLLRYISAGKVIEADDSKHGPLAC
jgi:hypothetical protein